MADTPPHATSAPYSVEADYAELGPRAREVLDCWFGAPGTPERGTERKFWFKRDDAVDTMLRERFDNLIDAANAGELDACERFEQHESERVGAARKHEDVGGRVDLREFGLRQHAQIVDLRIARLQLGERRTFARDPLRAGQIELQECLDVLLDRHASHVQEDRPRGVEHLRVHRMEDFEIDAARPQHDVREAELLEVLLDDGGRRHYRERRLVEPVQKPVGRRERNAKARLHVLGKARVIRGRERQLVFERIRARGHSQRTFGRDVQRVGRETVDALAQPAARQQRQAYLRVSRARDGAEFERRQQVDLMAERGEFALGVLQRAYDTVDLRLP